MPRCFVIQPFDDEGPFDQRFEEVLTPAIEAADLEAYRVDRDPGVSIPIDSIEDGIQGSDVCLADITLDNPNVWFEVGYAIAAKKEVVFICSEERSAPFPFDVQHRTITKYATESPSDFKDLQQKISQRLKAILKSNRELGAISKLSPTQETEGLAPHEVAALVILMEHRLSPDATLSPYKVRESMKRAGFTDVATAVGLNGLHLKGYMKYVEENDGAESWQACSLTQKGLRWIQDNQGTLVLTYNRVRRDTGKHDTGPEISDEDIPF